MANQTTVVASLDGTAWLRHNDGSLTPIKEGDVLFAGAEIVTAKGAEIQLLPHTGNLFIVGENQEIALTEELLDESQDSGAQAVLPLSNSAAERVIAALDAGE